MSVLIKGMEKPEHCGYCRFRYDGICHALQKTQYSMNECPLVVIDDVGLNDTISTSIDAVPVIRCKDCVCWDTSWKPTRAIEGAYWCSNNDIYTESDDYCSLGERKES